MKKTARLAFVLLLFAFAFGCAAGPKYAEMEPQMAKLDAGKGRIYMYRTTPLGMALQPEIKLNGQTVGVSKAGGFLWADREPGTYEVTTTTEVERKCSFTLESGQVRYVRFGVSMGFMVGHVYGELVDEAEGAKEIRECSYDAPAAPGAGAAAAPPAY
jgi:hypothetical protein